MATIIKYVELLKRYLSGSLNKSERRRFYRLTLSGKYDNILLGSMEAHLNENVLIPEGLTIEKSAEIYQKLLNEIKQAVSFRKQQSPRRFYRWWAMLLY